MGNNWIASYIVRNALELIGDGSEIKMVQKLVARSAPLQRLADLMFVTKDTWERG